MVPTMLSLTYFLLQKTFKETYHGYCINFRQHELRLITYYVSLSWWDRGRKEIKNYSMITNLNIMFCLIKRYTILKLARLSAIFQ
jgi:hypothetical protein